MVRLQRLGQDRVAFRRSSASPSGSYRYAMPPVMPAPKLSPIEPRITATPPVMYSHPFEPQPSTTTLGTRVADAEPLSRPTGLANSLPSVAP